MRERKTADFSMITQTVRAYVTQSGDPKVQELYLQMVERAREYAGIRTQWNDIPLTKLPGKNMDRSRLYDDFIMALDQLADQMKIEDPKKAAWRKDLSEDRRILGDFAEYLIEENRSKLAEGFIDTFIPSKDTREYLKKIGHTFSESDKAMIIANHAMLSPTEKVEWLGELQEMVSEDALKQRIVQEIADRREQIKENREYCWYESDGALYKHIFIPHDFRHGDIVKSLIDGEDEVGVILDYSEEDYEFYRTLQGDYSDVQICVDTKFRGMAYKGEFSHEHINPIYVERLTLPKTDERLGYLTYLIQSYEHMQYPKKLQEVEKTAKTGRTPNRIPMIMRVLEQVWKDNPDLRLGQLITVAAGKEDLFSMEDDGLMDGLWKEFIIPQRRVKEE